MDLFNKSDITHNVEVNDHRNFKKSSLLYIKTIFSG